MRFTTLAGLANELQEAESRKELGRIVGRYARTELVLLDELGLPDPARGRRRARLPGHLRAQFSAASRIQRYSGALKLSHREQDPLVDERPLRRSEGSGEAGEASCGVKFAQLEADRG